MSTISHPQHMTLNVTIQIVGDDNHRFPLRIESDATLLDLLRAGADSAGVRLIPPNQIPLDTLHNVGPGQAIGPAITDLEQSVGQFLGGEGTTKHFAIKLELAIRVNTRWHIAPSTSMTPREILALFESDFQQFTLYPPNSSDLLPLDVPIKLTRGTAFEAQKDGKYGGLHETA